MVANKPIHISPKTRIKVLLDADQQGVMASLIELNAGFSRLRHPMLRNLLAPRVSIADACRITGCMVPDFLACMAVLGFTVDEEFLSNDVTQDSAHEKIDFSRGTKVTVLDVRPYLEKKQDPLKVILAGVNKLGNGERIKIINTFEPVPLIDLLVEKGFLYHTDHIEEKLVATWFEKRDISNSTVEIPVLRQSLHEEEAFNRVRNQFAPEKIRYIDVRQLEMPQPMLLIIENMKTLADDELLYIYHKKVPVFLLPELESRGMKFLFNPIGEGNVEMLIYKP